MGIGLVLVAGATFASGSILATLSYAEGLDWLTVMWWRFLIGAALAWAWVLGSPRRRRVLRAMPRRQLAIALGLGAVYTGNAGTYYAGIETVPAALAGVLVYVYPVFVALLSLRFATRLPGRRPWIALALAIAGVGLALGGLDLTAAVSGDTIVGLVASAHDAPAHAAHGRSILAVGVTPSARRQGLATAMLRKHVQHFGRSGPIAASVTLAERNRAGEWLTERGYATRRPQVCTMRGRLCTVPSVLAKA